MGSAVRLKKVVPVFHNSVDFVASVACSAGFVYRLQFFDEGMVLWRGIHSAKCFG